MGQSETERKGGREVGRSGHLNIRDKNLQRDSGGRREGGGMSHT